MQDGVLDSELPQLRPAPFDTIQLFGQSKVLANHLSLLVQVGAGRLLAGGNLTCLGEDPRVADCTTSNRDSVNSRFFNHSQAIRCSKQITAAQYDAVRIQLFDFAQELPFAGTDIALLHGSAMDRDGIDTDLKRSVQNLEELVATFIRIIHSAPHLHGNRHGRRDHIARAADHFQCNSGLAQVIAAAAFAEHLS